MILTTLYRNGDIFVSFCWLSFKVLMVVLLEVALIHLVLGLSHWWEKLIKQHFFGGPNYRWCIIRFVTHGDRNLAAELSFCHLLSLPGGEVQFTFSYFWIMVNCFYRTIYLFSRCRTAEHQSCVGGWGGFNLHLLLAQGGNIDWPPSLAHLGIHSSPW